jgi:hypothetical protein
MAFSATVTSVAAIEASGELELGPMGKSRGTTRDGEGSFLGAGLWEREVVACMGYGQLQDNVTVVVGGRKWTTKWATWACCEWSATACSRHWHLSAHGKEESGRVGRADERTWPVVSGSIAIWAALLAQPGPVLPFLIIFPNIQCLSKATNLPLPKQDLPVAQNIPNLAY